jgi:hypothetical protein
MVGRKVEVRAPAADVVGDRRVAERLEPAHNAALRLGSVRYVVEVADVSLTGARVTVRQGLMPSAGQHVELQFMGGAAVVAEVVWIEGIDAGLAFEAPLGDLMETLYCDDLGAEFFSAVLRFQLAGGPHGQPPS